jgi:hypothetical protein
MASDDLKKIVDQLNEQGKMHFLDAATQEQIDQYEKEKRIKLPEKYKEWLLFSDGGEFFLPAGVQVYGVAHKPIIDTKDDDRPNDNYVVIGRLSWGDPVLFEKGKEQISFYNHEDGKIEENEVYEDFFAFLKDLYSSLGIGE